MARINNQKGGMLLTLAAGAAFILVGVAPTANTVSASTPGDGWVNGEYLDSGYDTAFDWKPSWDSSLVPEGGGSVLAIVSCDGDMRAWVEPAQINDDGTSKPVYVSGPDFTRARNGESPPKSAEIALLVVTPSATSVAWSSGCINAEATSTEALKAWYQQNELLTPETGLAPGATVRVDPVYPQIGMSSFDPYDEIREVSAPVQPVDLVNADGARVVVRPGDDLGELTADDISAAVTAAVGEGFAQTGNDVVPVAELPGSGVYMFDPASGMVLWQSFTGGAPVPVSATVGGLPVVPAAPAAPNGSASDPTTPTTGDGTPTTAPAVSDTGGAASGNRYLPDVGWQGYVAAFGSFVLLLWRTSTLRRFGYPILELLAVVSTVWLLSGGQVFVTLGGGIAIAIASPPRTALTARIFGTAHSRGLEGGYSTMIRFCASIAVGSFVCLTTLNDFAHGGGFAAGVTAAILSLYWLSASTFVAHPIPRMIGDQWVLLWGRRGWDQPRVNAAKTSTMLAVTGGWMLAGVAMCLAGNRFADGWDFLGVMGLVWLILVPPYALWRSARDRAPDEPVADDIGGIITAILSFTPPEKLTRAVRGLDGQPVDVPIPPRQVVLDRLQTWNGATVVYDTGTHAANPDQLTERLQRAVPSRLVSIDGTWLIFDPVTPEELERRRIAMASGGLITDTMRDGSLSGTLPPPTGPASTPPPAGVDLDWDNDDD